MTNSIKFLGLARRAGFLEIGEESTGAAARAHKARLLVICSDSSENARKRAANFSAAGNVPCVELPCSKLELGAAVGVGSPSMAAVTDIGMASGFLTKLASENPGRYEECAQDLAHRAEKAMQRKKEAKAHERNVKMGKRRKNV